MGDRLRWDTDGAGWPHRQASRFVLAGGQRWHVQVMDGSAGPADRDRPVLWLLHGTGAASHSFRALLPLLAPQARLVVPDLPGHGFSDALPARRQSLTGMAAALGELAVVLGQPPSAVVGHSAGAALALRAVLDGHLAPQRLLGLNAALLPFGGLAAPVLVPVARWLARRPLLPWLFARRARDGSTLRRLLQSTGSRLDADGLALYGQLIRSPAHVAGALAMMSDWDLPTLWQDLPRLAVPLDLLVGGHDGTVAPAQAQRVQQRLPGTGVTVLPGLGHLAHEEAPALVADWLLARLAPPAPPAPPVRPISG